MNMFFKRKDTDPKSVPSERLRQLVAETLHGADDATIEIVTACAGLLACVGFADRSYAEVEQARVRSLLTRIHGIGDGGAAAIDEILRQHVREFATIEPPRFTRILREQADRELRSEVLAMLLEVAAADDVISHEEVTLLRQLSTALGLEQSEYNRLQSKHKDKLAVLK